jgi:hypothetical protein
MAENRFDKADFSRKFFERGSRPGDAGYNELLRALADREAENAQLQDRVRELEASMVKHFNEEHLAGNGPEIQRWKNRCFEYEEEIETLRLGAGAMEQLQAENIRIKNELCPWKHSDCEQKIAALESRIRELEKSLGIADQAVIAALGEMAIKDEKIATLEAQLAGSKDQIIDAVSHWTAKCNEIETLLTEQLAECLSQDKTQCLTCKAKGVVCPFCGEADFDLEGLDNHLHRYCEKYGGLHAQSEKIAALEAQLAKCGTELAAKRGGVWKPEWTYEALLQYVNDTSDGFECLPSCDSNGHEEECPVTNVVAAFRILRQKLAAKDAELALRLESKLKEASRSFDHDIDVSMKQNERLEAEIKDRERTNEILSGELQETRGQLERFHAAGGVTDAEKPHSS